MRIIAGEFRGRSILAPEGDVTRPITDRVKQSLFDMIAGDLADAVVYDCFSGTGSMGLESLSRGARLSLFFEADRSAISRLKKNIAALGAESRARVVAGDLFKWFTHSTPRTEERASVIFLDPPYRFVVERSDELRQVVSRMVQFHLVAGGYIVFRHDAKDNLSFADAQEFDRRDYGGMAIRFLRSPVTISGQ